MNGLEKMITNTYKIKEREERSVDAKKCDYYLSEINNGNYTVLSQAQKFSEDTYIKYGTKDRVIVAANTNIYPSNLDSVAQLKVNLNALKRMIAEIEGKEALKEQDEKTI